MSGVSTAAVAHHYDEIDPFYREVWGEHVHHGLWERGDETPEEAVRTLSRRVASAVTLAEMPRPARVVDIGCGYGGTAILLHAEHGAEVTGITLSPVQHAWAEQATRGVDGVRFLLGDWLGNGLPDAAFDAAIAIESTEHMADKPGVFAEAARVVRPGGRLAVCAWLAASGATRLQVRHLLQPIRDEGRLASLDDESRYVEWIRGAGFSDIGIVDLSRRVARTWSICARRMVALLRRADAWRYLLDRRNSERVFAVTVLRMMAAYRTGCLRYALITATRP